MNAIKKSYDYQNNVITEKQYGSLIGIQWTNEAGNTFRCFTTNPINAGCNRKFTVDIQKEICPVGETKFIPYENYQLIADDSTYRKIATGQKVDSLEALDEQGNINAGYLTDAQFFINFIGYNLSNSVVSLYDYIYSALATKEGVNII